MPESAVGQWDIEKPIPDCQKSKCKVPHPREDGGVRMAAEVRQDGGVRFAHRGVGGPLRVG
jgi:hypothetical protein